MKLFEFKQKRKVVAAQQWDGTLEMALDLMEWINGGCAKEYGPTLELASRGEFIFRFRNSVQGVVNSGDWVVRDRHGEFGVMTDEYLHSAYEPIEEHAT